MWSYRLTAACTDSHIPSEGYGPHVAKSAGRTIAAAGVTRPARWLVAECVPVGAIRAGLDVVCADAAVAVPPMAIAAPTAVAISSRRRLITPNSLSSLLLPESDIQPLEQ